MTEPTQEKKGMDAVAISSLIVLATNIANMALKYSDQNTTAPSTELVLAHLEEFKKIQPLPEDFDVPLVDDIMGYIKGKFGL